MGKEPQQQKIPSATNTSPRPTSFGSSRILRRWRCRIQSKGEKGMTTEVVYFPDQKARVLDIPTASSNTAVNTTASSLCTTARRSCAAGVAPRSKAKRPAMGSVERTKVAVGSIATHPCKKRKDGHLRGNGAMQRWATRQLAARCLLKCSPGRELPANAGMWIIDGLPVI